MWALEVPKRSQVVKNAPEGKGEFCTDFLRHLDFLLLLGYNDLTESERIIL